MSSCSLRKNRGSGYSKTGDSENSRATVAAMNDLVAARAAQDARLFPPLTQNVVSVIQRTEPPDFSNSEVSTSTRR